MEWWSLRIFLRCSEPRRRIGDFFLSRWSWSDECWFFSRQSFSGFRTHVAATAVCKTEGCTYTHLLHAHFSAHGACTATFAYFLCVSHTRMTQAQVVSKRCLLHVYHTSPSCFLYLMSHPSLLFIDGHFETIPDLTSTRSCRIYLSWKRRASAPPHEQRGVWLSGQVRPQHRLWAQEVRQNLFCGQWHDARWRSRPPWNLWLLEKHTREHWTVRCSHNVWTLRFARFSRWFCSSTGKQRKHASGNRLLHRERKEREGSVISVVKSMSKKNRRNSVRSHSLQTLRKFFSDGWHLRENLQRRAQQAVLGENSDQRRLYLTQYNMEIQNLERRNSEHARFESQRELESQRRHFLKANQWADQAPRESIQLWSRLGLKDHLLKELCKKLPRN